MFPVRIMLMYWSAVARFRNNPEHTVDATMLAVFFMKRTNREVMLPSMSLAVMAPPKHMAQMMSQMVFIIPAIPRVAISSVNMYPCQQSGEKECDDGRHTPGNQYSRNHGNSQ